MTVSTLDAYRREVIRLALEHFAERPNATFIRLRDLPIPSSWAGRALQGADAALADAGLAYVVRRGWPGLRHLGRVSIQGRGVVL